MRECGVCCDNRFEIIEIAKNALLNDTNIGRSKEEMDVIDNILFRCWQMGWLRKYETENLTFGEALEYANDNKLIARIGWNGMFAFMRPSDTIDTDVVVNNVKSLPKSVKKWIEKNHKESFIRFSSYLCLKTTDGTIVNGWVPSQADLNAVDWFVLPDE